MHEYLSLEMYRIIAVFILGGHCEIVELLLANRADVNAANSLKVTPLHYAVQSKSIYSYFTYRNRSCKLPGGGA